MRLDRPSSTVMPPPAVTLTFGLSIPKSEPKYICVQNLVKFPSLVFQNYMVFTRVSGHTDSRTHSRTDRPAYRMPPAPFFNGDEPGGGIEIADYSIYMVKTTNSGLRTQRVRI